MKPFGIYYEAVADSALRLKRENIKLKEEIEDLKNELKKRRTS